MGKSTSAQKKDTKKNQKYNPKYVLSSEKINILLMGTSGSGKSTLINAILPSADAPTGEGDSVTKEMKPYTEDNSPITLIDSIGYEYNVLMQLKLKNEISKWTKTGVKGEDASKLIHMIWFCIDGQSKRIFKEVLSSLRNVAKTWKDIPIIVVFTKSYGTEEDDLTNARMFQEALNSYKHKDELNIKEQDIIPVVAKPFESAAGEVPTKGLDKLMERTKQLIPEAQKNAENAVKEIIFGLKITEANLYVVGTGLLSAAIGAANPTPIPDAAMLVPLQTGLAGKLTKIYEMQDDSTTNNIINAALKVSATTYVGKKLLEMLKKIPGFGVIGAPLNGIAAAAVTVVFGEAIIIIYDKIAKKEIVVDTSIDWEKTITDIFNDKLPKLIAITENHSENITINNIPNIIKSILTEYFTKKEE